MKKFLPVLALVASLCGPVACQQKDNEVTPTVDLGQKIDSIAGLGEKTASDDAKRPAVDGAAFGPAHQAGPACMQEINEAAPMSSDNADHILLALESMGSFSKLMSALNAAGYDYADTQALFDNMTAGNFPGKYAEPKLLKFFEAYDSDFAEKVAAVREAKNNNLCEGDVLSAKNLATLRLVELLDIVFRADAKGRETNTQFTIGEVNYTWDVSSNGISVSHSHCGQ